MISETHGSDGEALALSLPDDIKAWFSPGTASRAGVGLLSRQSFLDQFLPVREKDWIQATPGRAAVLRLRVVNGALDLWTIYGAIGTNRTLEDGSDSGERGGDKMSIHLQRQTMRNDVAAAMTEQSHALTIMSGDFNWVKMESLSTQHGLPVYQSSTTGAYTRSQKLAR